ncbi:6-bladed beta-propeller [Algoriphagus yeomjeoni]|uniref:6-bladed beta-propeller protein n=1 Tax=Algoriphagus yeomjeoni TaxID=291403 RepID=A0A327PCX4_9BACT|nr:6-bladed beta-propeller [Algoriphagus yeomjeoni]RAI90045.1 6-bladed beta-propeller protein [Algoriphagus yeomjeoni]
MIKRLFHIFKILFFCAFFSCGQTSPEEVGSSLIKIKSTASVKDLKLKSARLVSFSDNSFSPIGSLFKVISIEERIVVVDKIKGNAVLIFDDRGRYLSHIYRIGDGPGEYKNLENIYYDEKEKLLILIPMDYRKKYFFDLNGNFIREERYNENIYYSDLLPSDDIEILVNNGSLNLGDGFQVFENNQLITSAIPYVNYLDNTPLEGRNLISQINEDNFNFTVGNRDTIFRYNTKSREISTDYIFDFESPISKIDYGNHPSPLEYFVESQMFIGIFDIFQNDNFLSFTTFKYPRIKGRLLSKSTNKLYDTEEFIRQEVGDLGFEGILGMGHNGEFIAVLKAGEDGNWDFSNNKSLADAALQMGELESEEFLLLFFEIDE